MNIFFFRRQVQKKKMIIINRAAVVGEKMSTKKKRNRQARVDEARKVKVEKSEIVTRKKHRPDTDRGRKRRRTAKPERVIIEK